MIRRELAKLGAYIVEAHGSVLMVFPTIQRLVYAYAG